MLQRFALLLWAPVLAGAAKSPFHDLFFEPNYGQADSHVRYLARAHGADLAWTDDGVLMRFGGASSTGATLRFPGSKASAKLEPLDETPDRTSYFIGGEATHYARNVPHFRRLAVRGLYRGIDLIFYGRGGNLEYDFVVAPGADPALIRMAVDAPASLSFNPAGDLKIVTDSSSFELKRPDVYQSPATTVRAAYKLDEKRQIQFTVGSYNRKRPLIIDPILSFASYIGGENEDSVVALTAVGDIVGVTNSLSFGANTVRRGKDIFAMVPNQYGPGSQLLIFGGSGDDVPTCAAADYNTLVVGGWTDSKDFVGALARGGKDGFLMAVDRRRQSNFAVSIVGGSGDDSVNALWGVGNTIFAGETGSPNLTLPSGEAMVTHLAGGTDAFVGRASTGTGSLNIYDLAYFGGSGNDRANAVAADYSGQIVIAGKTSSPDLPLQDALSSQLSGPSDAFLSRFAPWKQGAAPTVEFSTYFGGSGEDEIRGIALSSSITANAVFFAGTTSSRDLKLANPAQFVYGGGDSDAFAGRLDLDARQLVFSTYIGGSGNEEGNAIANGGLFPAYNPLLSPAVTGSTTSADLPVLNASQKQLAGPQDAFLAAFDRNGALQLLTYFGGSGSERGLAVAISADNIATIGGETSSTDLPLPVRNPVPSAPSGVTDGFVAGIPLTAFEILGDLSGYWTGKDLLVAGYVYLSGDVPANAQVTVTSSDPSLVQVAFDNTRSGAASVSVPVVALTRPTAYFYIIGLANSGEVTLTVSLQGFGSRQVRVRLAPPVVQISTNARKIVYPGETVSIQAAEGVVDDQGVFHSGIPRMGAPEIEIHLSASNPALGQFYESHYVLGDPRFSSSLSFTALIAGEETITATSSGPPVLNASGFTFTIAEPRYTLADFTMGRHLNRFLSLRFDYRVTDTSERFTITSDDPARLCLVSGNDCAGSVIVQAANPSFTVRALAESGVAHLHYSNARLGDGIATVQLARASIHSYSTAATLSPGDSYIGSLYYAVGNTTFSQSALEPAYLQQLVATSADPNIATAFITPQGPLLTAVSPGQTVATVSAPDFDGSASVALTVTPRSLSFAAYTPFNNGTVAIGKDLQTYGALHLPVAGTARVTSSDPSRLLVSLDSNRSGTGQLTTDGSFYLQALTDSGAATVTVTAAGFPDLLIPVVFVPSGFAWSDGAFAVTSFTTTDLSLTTYALDPGKGFPLAAQPLRPGFTAAPSIATSDPSVGTFKVRPGSGSLPFTAGASGSTVLTLTQPNGMSAPSLRSSTRIIVNPALISGNAPSFLGRDLQTVFTPTLQSQQKLPITVSSGDTSRLLVSNSATAMGTERVDTTTTALVYLQGLAADGTAELRVSGAGLEDTVFPVTLTSSGVELKAGNFPQPPPITLNTFSPDLTLQASLFANGPLNNASGAAFSLRPGVAPLAVPVSSSQPKVLRPSVPAVTFNPGSADPLEFTVSPQSEGSAVIGLSPPPPFHADSRREQLAVKITLPSFTPKPVTVGKDFEVQASLEVPGITLPSTIIVTLSSNDPSRVLLSTRADQLGQPRISVALAPNSNNVYFVHGVALGQAAITASATGFADTLFGVDVVQPKLFLGGPQTAIVGSDNRALLDFYGQALRPGVALSINLRSSNPAVATVVSPVSVAGSAHVASAAITSISPGVTTISADLPDGWLANTGATSFVLAVRLPAIPIDNFSDQITIGKDLQSTSTLFQTSETPITITIASADASRVSISRDAMAAGQGTVTFTMPPFSQTPIYIQALSDTGTVALTYSIPGFNAQQQLVTLAPAAIAFTSTLLNTTKGTVTTVHLSAAPATPQGVAGGLGSQGLRGGLPPLSVAVTSSQPSVGTVKSPAVFNAGDSSSTLNFSPLTPGTTNLTITPPLGFVRPPTNGTLIISVN